MNYTYNYYCNEFNTAVLFLSKQRDSSPVSLNLLTDPGPDASLDSHDVTVDVADVTDQAT